METVPKMLVVVKMKTKPLICLVLLIMAVALSSSLPLAHSGGRAWISSFSPTTKNLFDVFMVNATDGWIVGDDGTILHWDGVSWTAFPSPTTEDLRGIYMDSSTNGWAVGLNGVTIHWNGTAWESVNSGTTENLLDVGATYLTASYYAVGHHATMLWWNETSEAWEPQTVPTTNGLRAITMFDFLIWVPYPPPGHMEIIRDGWCVGDSGTILHWDGTWTSVSSPTIAQLNKVSRLSNNDAWAVGSSWTMLHWDGTQWSIVSTPKSGYGWFSALYMVNSTDGWAMGYGGSILHWDGTSWSEVASPTTETLNSVFMVNATEGWAVGLNGVIIRWTGTEWVIPEFPTSLMLSTLLAATALITLYKTKIKRTFPR
jgi:photosystem II stability/assembly factor-like uncharacterized protein